MRVWRSRTLAACAWAMVLTLSQASPISAGTPGTLECSTLGDGSFGMSLPAVSDRQHWSRFWYWHNADPQWYVTNNWYYGDFLSAYQWNPSTGTTPMRQDLATTFTVTESPTGQVWAYEEQYYPSTGAAVLEYLGTCSLIKFL